MFKKKCVFNKDCSVIKFKRILIERRLSMNIFKKIITTFLIFIFVVITGYCADNQVYTWKMGSIYNDPATETAGNSLGKAMQKFVDLVKEKTNGQVIVKPYYGSVLGGQVELFEQVSRGQLEVFMGQPMSSIDKRFGAWSVPYLFNSFEELRKIVSTDNNELFQLSEQWIKENHGKLIAIGPSNLRGFANNKHKVKSIKDLKGLKVRTYPDPILNIFWSPICITQPLSWAETYSALQTKTVDGLEHPISTFLTSIGELIKYYTDIDWQWANNAMVIVNEKFWEELPDNLQILVKQAGMEAMLYQAELEEINTKEAYDSLEKERGYDITILTPEERQEWVEYARNLDGKIAELIGEDIFIDIMNAVQISREQLGD